MIFAGMRLLLFYAFIIVICVISCIFVIFAGMRLLLFYAFIIVICVISCIFENI